MYHSTGLTKKLPDKLHARIAAREIKPGMRAWPPILGLRESITVTLKYLRRNRVQADIAGEFGVSRPTASRAISAVMPLLVQALMEFVPSADSLSHGRQFIVDGTLLPCRSWRSHPDLYPGKHKRTGMSVLVACTLDGVLSWISDPVPGSRHDNFTVKDSSVLDRVDPIDHVGDKGFVGNGMITPFKKPAGGMLPQWQKEFNSQVNKIRWVIEQKISHLKTWQSMNTDYRRPIGTFTEAISAVPHWSSSEIPE